MLKKILKRLEWEISQAQDYIDQAFMVKSENHSLAELFIELGKEEIVHAEKLMREGNTIISNLKEHDDFVHVWKWIYHKNVECINDLNVKINRYRSF
jgi:Mn-containing catalase